MTFEFDASAFQSPEIEVWIDNKTAKTDIRDGSRHYGDEKVVRDENLALQIHEILDNGLVLEVPSKTCSLNHHLDVGIRIKSGTNEHQFRFPVLVHEVQGAGEGRETVLLHLADADASNWEQFTAVFFSRQDDVDTFMKAAKGE